MLRVGIVLVLLLYLCRADDSSSAPPTSSETFSEFLHVRPLPDGLVALNFQFIMRLQLGLPVENHKHFTLFPMSLAQIIQHSYLEACELTLTQGRWESSLWGLVPEIRPAPHGAQLLVWFSPLLGSSEVVQEGWDIVRGSLGGTMSVSLGLMGESATASPLITFASNNASEFDFLWESGPMDVSRSYLFRWGSLPHEPTCTENLTPWLKFLPCGEQAGLASLLNSVILHSHNYMSLRLAMRAPCISDSSICLRDFFEVEQSFTIVLQSQFLKKANSFRLPSSLVHPSRTVSELVACPLAERSEMIVWEDSLRDQSELSVEVTGGNLSRVGEEMVWQLPCTSPGLELDMQWPNGDMSTAWFYTLQAATGHGQRSATLVIRLLNSHPNQTARVVYFAALPFFLLPYFSTLRVEVVNDGFSPEKAELDETFRWIHLIPGIGKKPSTIEFGAEVLPLQELRLHLYMEKAFLHLSLHPPDANRGWDVPSGVLFGRFLSSDSSASELFRLYTNGLLITLPLPDFSMPYNVITLTCTLFAMFFTSMFVMTVRRWATLLDGKGDFVSDRPLARIFRRVAAYFYKNKLKKE